MKKIYFRRYVNMKYEGFYQPVDMRDTVAEAASIDEAKSLIKKMASEKWGKKIVETTFNPDTNTEGDGAGFYAIRPSKWENDFPIFYIKE